MPDQLRADGLGEAETTPIMIGAFAIPDNQIEECLDQAITEPGSGSRGGVCRSRTTTRQCSRTSSSTRGMPRPARHRHLDAAQPQGSGVRAHGSSGHRADVSDFQGWPHLLGRQRHGAARCEIHGTPQRRAARTRFGCLRGQCDEPASVARDSAPHRRGAEIRRLRASRSHNLHGFGDDCRGRTTFGFRRAVIKCARRLLHRPGHFNLLVHVRRPVRFVRSAEYCTSSPTRPRPCSRM